MLPARITILSSDPQLPSHVQLHLHSKDCQAAAMACIDSARSLDKDSSSSRYLVDNRSS